MLITRTMRRYIMIIWLIISIPVVVVFLLLMSNQANLSQAPGFASRLNIFLRTHQAEISRHPVLPELQSPHINMPVAQFFEQLPAIIQALGWEIKQTDESNYRLHAVVTTALWKFRDDIDISVKVEGDGCYLLAHSRSRIGRADFAANSSHLQLLLKQLKSADQ